MKIFDKTQTAFGVFFEDSVEVTLKNNIRFTINACVFPIEQVDPFVDSDYQNDVKLICILISKNCYPDNLKPQVGDKITLENSEVYYLNEISDEQTWFKCIARSK